MALKLKDVPLRCMRHDHGGFQFAERAFGDVARSLPNRFFASGGTPHEPPLVDAGGAGFLAFEICFLEVTLAKDLKDSHPQAATV